MIACECLKCGKPLKVKDDLAGKKVKCPECGQAVPVPAPSVPTPTPAPRSPALSGGLKRTPVPLPPPESSDPEGPTVPPDSARSPTEEAPSQQTIDDGSVGKIPAEQYPPELTDFLAPPQAPGEIGRLGSYRVLSVLGAGGMGVVFKAEDPSLKRLVAIKAMLPSLAASASARERFKREAQAAAAIKHDHIVTIHQVAEDRGAPFLAMEFLSGESLDERLKRDGILPVAEIIRIGKEVALALEAAHEVGMIHRDIKPGNIWLESRGQGPGARGQKTGSYRVKILDFGLARAAGKESQLTQQGAIIGTPAYMAPEQAAGKEVDVRCDLFSLGCVLYRMCTGDLPFKGTDTISTLMAVATFQPPSPREVNRKVPVALSDLIEELLKKRAHERPESARAVYDALDAIPIDKSMDTATPVPARKAKVASGGQKKKWFVAGAVGTALVVVAALALLLNRGKDVDGKTPITPARGVPADQLKAENIAEEDKALAGGGDPGKAPPALVAVLHSGTSTVSARGIKSGRGVQVPLQIGVSDDGKTLTSLDGPQVASWDLATGKELHRFSELFPQKVTGDFAVDLNATGDKLAWDDGVGNIAFFDLVNPKKGTLLVPNPKGVSTLKAINFSADSKLFLLVPAPTPSTARLFNTETKQFQGNLSTAAPHQAYDLAPDSKTFATASRSRIQLNALPFMKIKGIKPPALTVEGTVSLLKFSPDAKELISVSSPGYHFILWDLKNEKEIHQFGGHSQRIRTVAFNPDGKVIASAGDDNLIKVFDRITQQELHHIAFGPKGMEIHQLMFTPEGTHLAAATNLGRVFIFRLPLPAATKPNLIAPEAKKEAKPPEEKKDAKEPEKKPNEAEKKAVNVKVEAGWTLVSFRAGGTSERNHRRLLRLRQIDTIRASEIFCADSFIARLQAE